MTGFCNIQTLSFWIIVCFWTGVFSKNVTLSPEIAAVIENGSVTLTCWYDGTEEVTSSRWIYSGASANPVIVQIDDTCVAVGFLNNTALYAWECRGNNLFSLTLKKIERQNHGDTWSCRQTNIESNTVSIYVKVPVNKVGITTPKGNLTTMSENSSGRFVCTTTPARPIATIKWFLDKGTSQADKIQISKNVTQANTTNNDGLIYTIGTLMYEPTRQVNGLSLYCTASNVPKQQVESNIIFLNVTYSPDGPPYIHGFQNESIYRVIENTVGKLSCSVRGGNPLASISWICFDKSWKISSDGNIVTTEISWTVSRNQTGTCICRSEHIESERELVIVNVDVLYEPSKPAITVRNVTVPSSENIKIIRHNTFLISCNSSSNPSPSFKWTVPGGKVNPGQILKIVNFQTSNEGSYLCTAENTMPVSGGDVVTGTRVSYVNVTMLYPPTTPIFRYGNLSGPLITYMSLDMILGDTFTVACISNGEPEPNYSWSNQKIKSQILTVTSFSSDFASTCTATNIMNETVGESREGQTEAKLSVFILYPPSAPTIYLYFKLSNYINVSGSIEVIEQSSFTLTCDATSIPRSSYSWYGQLTSTSSELTIENIKREQTGVYSCHAFNTMKRSFGKTERGENNTSIHIAILHAPEIGRLKNKTAVEGASLNITCPVKPGNPSILSVHWTRDGDDILWNGQQLVIPTVLRNDSMAYTCTVNNTMEPTVGDVTDGRISKQFYLDVLYKARVVDFFVNGYYGQNPVTIDENVTVEFRCNIDSNPKSIIKIHFMEHILKTTKDNSLALVYMRQSAGCLHAGVYICTGLNEYNSGEPSKKYLTLNVKCSPRPSPKVKIRNIIFTVETVPAILSFTALAYPVPAISDYKWRRYVGSVWMPLANSDNILINTAGLQSNLTILEVGQSDYGTYRLDIENSNGIFEQMFKVGPEEKPNLPTDFGHIDDLTTESSFTVRWRPGLDGGPAQTFILRYKKSSVQLWINVSIIDNGKDFMNYTFSGLESGSEYVIVLYSVNKLGKSPATDELRIRTNGYSSHIAKTQLPITGIISGTLATAVVVVILVVSIICIRRRSVTSRHNKRLTTTNCTDKKDESNKFALNETVHISEYEIPDNPCETTEKETKVDHALKMPEPIYDEIGPGDETLRKSQLQQYELIAKRKGSVHAYQGLHADTKHNKILQTFEKRNDGIISALEKYENLRI